MTKAVLELEDDAAARRTVAAVPSPALAVPFPRAAPIDHDTPRGEQLSALRILHHGSRCEDRMRDREALRAGGDIHCLTEIVLSLVKYHREARTVDPDF
jgi:hypothetical protein